MSTSDIDKRRLLKTALVYTAVSVFCALFGMIYESFSHGVYSNHMLYFFLWPLCGGVLLFLIFALRHAPMPRRLPFNLYNSAIATLTVGSIMCGVTEIYGTATHLCDVYFVIGAILAIAAIVTHIRGRKD